MNKHQTKIKVRDGETDQMGVVYHGNYIPYFEMGRVEWLRNKGVSYKKMEEEGIILSSLLLNEPAEVFISDISGRSVTTRSAPWINNSPAPAK